MKFNPGTQIIIDSVTDLHDLIDGVGRVLHLFGDQPDLFAQGWVRVFFSRGDVTLEEQPTDLTPLEADEPLPGFESHGEHPLPGSAYVDCPSRGEHLRLTECWMCWSDVHSGRAIETQVLHPDAWDVQSQDLADASEGGETV